MDDECEVIDERDIYHVVEEAGFTALFLLGADDQPDTVEDVDARLRLPDGTEWTASFMTLDAIQAVLSRWQKTGEYGGGVFFRGFDLVIVPKAGVAAMVEALRAIVAEGVEGTLARLEID